jgi:hypothetical protein
VLFHLVHARQGSGRLAAWTRYGLWPCNAILPYRRFW